MEYNEKPEKQWDTYDAPLKKYTFTKGVAEAVLSNKGVAEAILSTKGVAEEVLFPVSSLWFDLKPSGFWKKK